MSGQRFTNVAEVMVLVKLDDGTEHGWVINRPSFVEWNHAGLTSTGSARANVEIGVGEFYRRGRTSRPIGDEVTARLDRVEARTITRGEPDE